MEIRKHKGLLLSLIIIIGGIAMLSLVNYYTQPKSLVNTDSPIDINEAPVNSSIYQITYKTMRDLTWYDDVKGEPIIETVNIPQIVNGNFANSHIIDNINEDIIYNYTNNRCIDPDSAEDINDMYDWLYAGDENLKSTSTKDKLKYIAEKNVSSQQVFKVKYMNDKLLSIELSSDEYCGGVHPNNYIYGLNYDLNLWKDQPEKQISLKDLFSNYDKNKIKDIVMSELTRSYDEEMLSECKDALGEAYDYSINSEFDSEFDPFSFSFDNKGVYVLFFGLPRDLLPCEPFGEFISYERFGEYINKDFISKVAK